MAQSPPPGVLLFGKRASCEYGDEEDCYGDDFWWSNTGMGVRYAIVAVVFAVLVLFICFAYFHAQRRLRRGQPPLSYHRWLVSRRQYDPAPYPPPSQPQNRYAYYNTQDPAAYPPPQQAYPMQPYAAAEFNPPPPAYGNWDAPPVYQPPQGASKALANQNVAGVGSNGNEASGEGSSAGQHHAERDASNNHTQ